MKEHFLLDTRQRRGENVRCSLLGTYDAAAFQHCECNQMLHFNVEHITKYPRLVVKTS